MDETTRLWLWLNYATNRDSRLFFDLLSRVDDLSELYDADIEVTVDEHAYHMRRRGGV